jgi:hypothetical protein
MILSAKNQDKVNFANFCQFNGLDTFDVGCLCQLVQRRAKGAMANANVSHSTESQRKWDLKDDNLILRIKTLGKSMGLEITFPSCYASVTKNGRTINLPL